MTLFPIFVRSVLFSSAFLCARRLLFASHSENLAIPIRAPSLCAASFYSRAFSLCTVFSIREPCWKVCDFYSRAFLCAQHHPIREPFWTARDLYLHACQSNLCVPRFVVLGLPNGTYRL
jgi:hypothetical protein